MKYLDIKNYYDESESIYEKKQEVNETTQNSDIEVYDDTFQFKKFVVDNFGD
ncbi:MAG: hypothetical protein LBV58_00550 [Acholeplasmatales bacterium]|jgi:hypothetical protein|nr:hypothetical protein [Acholeplasmatales bacterium]